MKTIQILCQKSPWARFCLVFFLAIISFVFLRSAFQGAPSSFSYHDVCTLMEDSLIEREGHPRESNNGQDNQAPESLLAAYASITSGGDNSINVFVLRVLASTNVVSQRPRQHVKVSVGQSQAPPAFT